MEKLLYYIINIIYKCHSWFLSLNDAYEYNFTDKELHFLVIGVVGMAMLFAVYPVFKMLADGGHIMTITWIYVFTLIIVLTFAIEIGQKASGTGSMEFRDIVFGVMGFMAMYIVFVVLAGLIKTLIYLVKKVFSDDREDYT